MKKLSFTLLLFLIQYTYSQKYTILDSVQRNSVSYATISFDNGTGVFADADGKFFFSNKLYPNIDSLFITAIGYKDFPVKSGKIPNPILMTPDIAQLKEVYLIGEKQKKYKTKKIKAELHDDYFKCWLPTVESEIAVFFPKDPIKPTKITSIYLPIKLENSSKNSNNKLSFSTLFKMQFYENKNNFPGKRLPYEDIIFNITNRSKPNFELDIADSKIYIPKNGIFISIQVLGYADKKGQLEHTKKYHEVETKRGTVKISTTFRPLLPFTNTINTNKTFIRRIFFKNKTWQRFDKKYSTNNMLIQNNYTNYGMGLKLQLFEEN